ncbi:hypothetical protein GQ457_02G029970 [Hibiscus cannabinus]
MMGQLCSRLNRTIAPHEMSIMNDIGARSWFILISSGYQLGVTDSVLSLWLHNQRELSYHPEPFKFRISWLNQGSESEIHWK